MKRFVQGQGRTQSALLPECLDDYVAEDNAVRVIDVFVDELDLGKLGFLGVDPLATGRPAYHPSVLLKIYLYGYLNRVQSSRRLEWTMAGRCAACVASLWCCAVSLGIHGTLETHCMHSGKLPQRNRITYPLRASMRKAW